MSQFYRYKLPPWARKCILVCERCVIPIMIYQNIRTLLIPTTLDVMLSAIVTLIFIAFYLKWI